MDKAAKLAVAAADAFEAKTHRLGLPNGNRSDGINHNIKRMKERSMRYRPDIDGLRAISIIPVILFHAGFSYISGGFVGVDIFFVISGYLITNIIIERMLENKFSILEFFERRARRIIPILLIVNALTVFISFFVAYPTEFSNVASSAISSIFLYSDYFFRRSGGYFDIQTDFRPLLHTWSLSIEEKYYVIFPIIAIVANRLRRIEAVVISITLILFFVSIYVCFSNPEKAYFAFEARVWEILSGAVLSVLMHASPAPKIDRRIRSLLVYCSVALIVFPMLYYTGDMLYPGFYVLVPIFGALIMIYISPDGTLFGRVLSSDVFALVGRLSYSAYMWHLPIISLLQKANVGVNYVVMTAITATLFISYFSWRYIENPMRNRSVVNKRTFLALISIGFVLTCGEIYALKNIAKERLNSVTPERSDRLQKADTCFLLNLHMDHINTGDCSFEAGARKKVLLIGDSHAASLYPGLQEFGARRGFGVAMNAAASCLPLVQHFPPNRSHTATPRCERINSNVAANIDLLDPDLVIISAYMLQWANEAQDEWTYEGYYQDFLKSLAALSKKRKVLVVGQFPVWSRWLPDLVANDVGLKGSINDIQKYNGDWVDQDLFKFEDRYARDILGLGVPYTSVVRALCPEEKCQTFDMYNERRQLLTFDYGHLSLAGSHLVAEDVVGPEIVRLLEAGK